MAKKQSPTQAKTDDAVEAMPLEEGEINLIEAAEFKPLRNWTRFTTRREAISNQGFVLDKTWNFAEMKNIGYGELQNLTVRLVSSTDYVGTGFFTFRQNMRCQVSRVADTNDLDFTLQLWDDKGAYIRQISLGHWWRRCGFHLVELENRFEWQWGSIHPIQFGYRARLTCTHTQRVHKC